MVKALDRIDAGAERFRVELELTQAELTKVLAEMDAEKRSAFLSAGLRAALLV